MFGYHIESLGHMNIVFNLVMQAHNVHKGLIENRQLGSHVSWMVEEHIETLGHMNIVNHLVMHVHIVH